MKIYHLLHSLLSKNQQWKRRGAVARPSLEKRFGHRRQAHRGGIAGLPEEAIDIVPKSKVWSRDDLREPSR
jgi:hypothetical protein